MTPPANARSPLLRATLALVAGTGAGHLLVLISTPVVTRLYTPDDLGRFALWLSYSGLVSFAAALGYEYAIPGARSAPTAARLTVGAAALCIPLSVALAVPLAVLAWAKVAGYGALTPLSAVPMALATLLYGLVNVGRFWLIRQAQFGTVARVAVAQSFGRAFFPIGMAVAGLGWWSLAIAEVLSRSLGVSRTARAVSLDIAANAAGARWHDAVGALRERRSFALAVLPANAVDALSFALPVPLIAHLHGEAAAGAFAIVQRLLAGPVALLGRSAADAFQGVASGELSSGQRALERLFLRTSSRLLLIGVGPFAVFALLAPSLGPTVLGREWADVGVIASISVPGALAALVVSPVSRVAYVCERPAATMAYGIGALATMTLAVVASRCLHAPLPWSVAFLTLGQVLAYAVYFLLLWRTVRKFESRRA